MNLPDTTLNYFAAGQVALSIFTELPRNSGAAAASVYPQIENRVFVLC